MAKFERLRFQPHNGYGGVDPDGNNWPFGYISEDPGQPIFELNPVLSFAEDDLQSVALKMAAAADMHAALRGILSNPGGRCTAEQWQAGLAALAKAEGRNG